MTTKIQYLYFKPLILLTTICLIILTLINTGCYTDNESENSNYADCKWENGSHDATVDYTNPDTDYEATYDLQVTVENCFVTEIHFPKGGRLDSDHIPATGLDDDGNATIEDDRGRIFEIHIDD